MKDQDNHEPHWKLVERIVVSLEQALDPKANIEHNVQLFDDDADEWRQCDAVIRQGTPPRETITIVEVQDRPDKKVGLSTFEGWCRKLEKLKAQHLICVSVKGFTRGVIKEARKQRNTVYLLKLEELEQNAWPVNFREGKLNFFWGIPKLESYSVITQDNKRPGNHFKRRDVNFRRNGKPIQVNSLFAEYFPVIDYPTVEGEFQFKQRIEFGNDDKLLMIWDNNQARVFVITALYKIKVKHIHLSMTTSQYQQIDYDGALAWSIVGVGQMDGKDAMLRMIFLPIGNGLLKLAEWQASGAFDDLAGGILQFKVTKH